MLVSIISLLAAASAVTAQSSTVTPAPEITNNPIGAQYVGTLPQKEGSALAGSIVASSNPDGKGVKFAVSFSGLPEEGGPFLYHIHKQPVPADGNCTGTSSHLDPYMRGEDPPCDASKPETCEVGDLSGKHGKVESQAFTTEYTDLYASLLESDPAFFGKLSFVVHLSNKTRIGCANFQMVSDGKAPSGSGYPVMPPSTASSGFAHPSGMPTHNTTMMPSPVAPTTGAPIVPTSASTSDLPEVTANAAGKIAGSAGLLFAAAAALVL